MTDETKPEAMTAERLAKIRERAAAHRRFSPQGGSSWILSQEDVPALLSALEDARAGQEFSAGLVGWLEATLANERVVASASVERAALLDWVMAALRGEPVDDFAESFQEVREALDLCNVQEELADAMVDLDGARAELDDAEAGHEYAVALVAELEARLEDALAGREYCAALAEYRAGRVLRGDKARCELGALLDAIRDALQNKRVPTFWAIHPDVRLALDVRSALKDATALCARADQRAVDFAEASYVAEAVGWQAIAELLATREELVGARVRGDMTSAALLMVGSELAGDPKMDPVDRGDPRWTPTLLDARQVREERDSLRAQVGELRVKLKKSAASLRLAERDGKRTEEYLLEGSEAANRDAASAEARVAELEGALADARGLMERLVKYAREDRAVTPGFTRLARALEEAAALVGTSAAAPIKAPPPDDATAIRNAAFEEAARVADEDLLEQPGVVLAADERWDNGVSVDTASRIAANIRALKAAPLPRGAPDVRDARIAALEAACAWDKPWPLPDLLDKAAGACDHLIQGHSCDAHGWEAVSGAAPLLRECATKLRAALFYPNKLPPPDAPSCVERAPKEAAPTAKDVRIAELTEELDAVRAVLRTTRVEPAPLDSLAGASARAQGEATPPRPRIVCLCGPLRFMDTFRRLEYEEEMAGRIVVGPSFLPGATAHDGTTGCTPAQKLDLDELHRRKIDLADEVLVVNVGGYIGKSTQAEVAYARAGGKPVRWLEPDAQPTTTPPRPDAEPRAPHALTPVDRVLADIRAERVRQDLKWGTDWITKLPDGTGLPGDENVAFARKAFYEEASRVGLVTFRDCLAEEVAEAFAESDPALLRAELVQVAAVAAKWIQGIDTRAAVDDGTKFCPTCSGRGRLSEDEQCGACAGAGGPANDAAPLPAQPVEGATLRTCATCRHYDPDTLRSCPWYATEQSECPEWAPKSGGQEEHPTAAPALTPEEQQRAAAFVAAMVDAGPHGPGEDPDHFEAPAVAPDPFCARDIGDGKVCGHLRSRHVEARYNALRPCVHQEPDAWHLCPCPGFVPPAGTEGGETT